MEKITLTSLRKMKEAGEKFTSLTAYDASFARILDEQGVEVVLVGDSLGNVIQGESSTVPVTLDDMVYHSRCVRKGLQKALLMVDMPFMSDATPSQALHSAARLMQEGGAEIVKIEGGAVMLETVQTLSARGIPVCAHLGLLPQSVHKMGGYRVQGRDADSARILLADACAMEKAGADIILLECVPRTLAAEITAAVRVPVIGIGAGPQTDAQVLVIYDMLGISAGKRPRFSHNFLAETGDVEQAVARYVQAVKAADFPAEQHGY